MYALYLFVLVVCKAFSSFALESDSSGKDLSDSILCRGCGSDILKTDSIVSKSSPVALYSFYDSIFNKDEILVQVLSRDFVIHFPILTSTNSTCLGVGEWEENDNWFPGYHWKICVCYKCGAFVGWIFEPIDSSVIPNLLYALIPANLVGESFTEYLIKLPLV